MEEADQLLLQNFQKLGWSFDGSTLHDLKPADVYEVVSRSLQFIKPLATSHKCFTLPPNAGDRFRGASTLAARIKELGYREEIGYQTILYGSDVETRRLLLFLAELLPKEANNGIITTETYYDRIQQQMRQCLNEPHWVPWFCKRFGYEWDGRFWFKNVLHASNPFVSKPLQSSSPSGVDSFLRQTQNGFELSSSIVEHNERKSLGIHTYSENIHMKASFIKPTIARKPQLKLKPVCLPKPTHIMDVVGVPRDFIKPDESVISIANDGQVAASIHDDATSTIAKTQKDFTSEEKHLSQLESDIEELQRKILDDEHELTCVTTEIVNCEQDLASLAATQNAKHRLADLLPNIDDNIDKLKIFLNTNEQRSSKLMAQWDEHRRQIENELQNLRSNTKLAQYEESRRAIAELSHKIHSLQKDYANKAEQLCCVQAKHNSREVEESVGPSRTFYTKRILEVVASARKQKSEIDNVLCDIRVLQKDNNSLNGRLERTYVALDELMFQDAKKDELVKRAYKLIVNIYETCNDIVNAVEATGHVCRDKRDLEDKIELETQHGFDKKLEMLITNLCEIREENEKLISSLNERD